MSSEDLFESGEDDFSCSFNIPHSQNVSDKNDGKNDLNFWLNNLTKENFISLIDEICCDEKIKDGTDVVFFVFKNMLENGSIPQTFAHEDLNSLHFFSKVVNQLRKAGKFQETNFSNALFNSNLDISFVLMWWLHKEEIVYLYQFWEVNQPCDFADDLLNVIQSFDHNFCKWDILRDVFVEILSGCYGPRTGICRLEKSKHWSTFCSNTINYFSEKYVTLLFNENVEIINFLPLVNNTKLLPSNFKKRFCLNLIQKIVTCKNESYDCCSALLYQHLWTSQNLSASLRSLFCEIFSDICDINDLMLIFDNYEINWKYFLLTIAACINYSKRSRKIIRDIVQDKLLNMLKGGKLVDFKTCLLLIRQATLEENMDFKYDTWFSNTFGVNSTFKTTENQAMFKFFISCLCNIVSLEPEAFLITHVQKSIRAPPNCNISVLDYKDIGKARLKELRQYPSITLNGCKMNVLQLFENTNRLKNVDPILKQIMLKDYQNFYDFFVPFLNKNETLFSNVKDMFLSQKLVTVDILNHCKNFSDVITIIKNDDVEFLYQN